MKTTIQNIKNSILKRNYLSKSNQLVLDRYFHSKNVFNDLMVKCEQIIDFLHNNEIEDIEDRVLAIHDDLNNSNFTYSVRLSIGHKTHYFDVDGRTRYLSSIRGMKFGTIYFCEEKMKLYKGDNGLYILVCDIIEYINSAFIAFHKDEEQSRIKYNDTRRPGSRKFSMDKLPNYINLVDAIRFNIHVSTYLKHEVVENYWNSDYDDDGVRVPPELIPYDKHTEFSEAMKVRFQRLYKCISGKNDGDYAYHYRRNNVGINEYAGSKGEYTLPF